MDTHKLCCKAPQHTVNKLCTNQYNIYNMNVSRSVGCASIKHTHTQKSTFHLFGLSVDGRSSSQAMFKFQMHANRVVMSILNEDTSKYNVLYTVDTLQ